MPTLPFFIAIRYMRAKRRKQAISFTAFISIIAVGLGVMVLTTVMSVMNGFEKELTRGILSMIEHISFIGYGTDAPSTELLMAELRSRPEVVAVAPMIEGAGMVGQGRGTGVKLRGVYPRDQIRMYGIDKKIKQGDFLALGPGTIVIGTVLAKKLDVKIGDKISILTSRNSFDNPLNLPKIKRLIVVAIFEAGIHIYNERFGFIYFDDAVDMLLGASGHRGIQVNTADPFLAPQLAEKFYAQYGTYYSIRDWTGAYKNLFRAVKQQKGIMFVILSLIVAVAALSIVTTLMMMVTEKSSDIAILRTIGAKPSTILAVFIIQGFMIGVVGIIFGILGGMLISDNIHIIIAALERMFGIGLLPSDVYYISQLSGDRHWQDIFMIAFSAFLICLLATLYPAWKAAHTQPAKALKYE